MEDNTNKRIKNANEISKETLIETIKVSDPTRFDQMLIESEERKTYFYVKYNALAYTRSPKTLKFPLFKDLVNDFEKGIDEKGEPKILENDRIIQKVISKGYSPIDSKKYVGKNLVFQELKLITENDKVKLKQPLYYLPNETERCTCGTCNGDKYTTCPESECHGQHIYDCNNCNATGKIDCNECDHKGVKRCKTCKGMGEYKCYNCGGKGEKQCKHCRGKCVDSNGKRCTYCAGRGFEKCTECRDGIVKCRKCGAKGEIQCSNCSGRGEITCNKCDGKRQITCGTCYGDYNDNRYGKVDCETCETAGELASISYIETDIKQDNFDFIYTDKTEINAPGFGLETIKKFVNTNGQLVQTYNNVNGENEDNYDEYSTTCSKKALDKVGDYKDKYPKLISEEMYYEGVPCATYNYNHILSATFHDVSVLNIDKTKEVLFHSNPANVATEKESIKDKVKELLSKAFSTKSYKDKVDRQHEMFLIIHMAKADGVIEEEEKRYLSQNITGLHGFTAKEKAEIFSLMSSNSLPPILPTNAYFSSKERAEEARKKIIELVAKADGEYEPEEKAKMEEINNAIELGYKAKPSAMGRFFKTWQVSVSLLLLICTLSFGGYWVTYVLPVKNAMSLHEFLITKESNIKTQLEAGSDDNPDTYFDRSSTEHDIKTLSHSSELIYMNNQNYKDYWSEKQSYYLSLLNEIPEEETSKETVSKIMDKKQPVVKESSTEQNQLEGYSYTVSDPDGWSNLRETPNGEIIIQVFEGEELKIIKTEGSYKKVELKDGTVGYIHSSRIVELN